LVPKVALDRQNDIVSLQRLRLMQINQERIRANIQEAATEDLLDRATVFREGIEAPALELIEEELRHRGIDRDAVAEHERRRRETTLFDVQGIALKCHRCRRPAVIQTRGWHRWWGLLPLFPRRFAWCEEHRPRNG
jgi:hypothetical protein